MKTARPVMTMILDRYLFKILGIATVFVALTLAAVILLTQSLRFLDLVVNAGASSGAFWGLTLMVLPRFFEIILPLALTAGIIFVYNKMAMDSELTAMKATGISPLMLARPALGLSGIVAVALLVTTMWLAPAALSNMYELRQIIKTQYSALLFREGVFNAVGNGLTVFVRERGKDGDLRGLMIHDSRPENETPVTVLARRGVIQATKQGQQVLVYEGSRQALDSKTGMLNRLDFERYTIDLPDSAAGMAPRWREPEERSFSELINPAGEDVLAPGSRREFTVEAHRRLVAPLLAPAFAAMALACLLLGASDRRGQGLRITLAMALTIGMEGLYLACLNMARQGDFGLGALYLLPLLSMAAGLFLLSPAGEKFGSEVLPRFLVQKRSAAGRRA